MRRITKRKIKKFLSNNTYVLLFIAVFTILGFMTTGYALLKSTGTLNGFAEIIANSEPHLIYTLLFAMVFGHIFYIPSYLCPLLCC